MARTKKLTRDELLAKKRAAEKARRDKIKLNPEAHAQYKEKEKQRYKKRKEDKKLQQINDLTPRQQRNQRRKWKLNSKNFRERQKQNTELQNRLAESTPPDSDSDDAHLQNILPAQPSITPAKPSPAASPSVTQHRTLTRSQGGEISASLDMPETSQQYDSRKSDISSTVKRRLRYNVSKKLLFYKKQLDALKKQNNMLRKRVLRSNDKLKKQHSKSPRTKAENLLSDPNKKEDVKKALVFAEVMKRNLTSNYENLKTHEDKKAFKENIKPACKTLKNYKILKSIQPKLARKVNLQRKPDEKKYIVQEDIKTFFESDDNSRMAAGKKECITRKKEKKQKRYLQDTLINLHKKFLETHQYTVSYSLFCYNKPFWVVTPKDKDMETCMCKLHENITLLAQALWKNKIIQEKSSSEVLSATVCSIHNLSCLERKCPTCVNKVPMIMDFDNSVEIGYWMWQSGSKEVNTKTATKIIKITEKKLHKSSPKDVIGLLLKDLEKFYTHCANILNQYKCTTSLKKQLVTNEAVIHMDFSENYSTKYNTEIQSMHFGGSRTQISLHTCVVYIPGLDPKSFCTYSDCLRHDAHGVWGHIIPILKYIENIAPNTDTLHFITDSTCSQYRNKTINYMITKLHWYLKNLICITWNYTEAGHGKGAPDGVGATLKRTADQIVRHGRDIPDVETFATEMKKALRNVFLEYVSEYDIYEKEYLMPSVLLKPFKGMMQVHQIVWNKSSENSIVLRRQSCISELCRNNAATCVHGKHLGYYDLPKLGNPGRIQREMPTITSNILIVPGKKSLPANCMDAESSSFMLDAVSENLPNEHESNISHLSPDLESNEVYAESCMEDVLPTSPGSLFSTSHLVPDLKLSQICDESPIQDVVVPTSPGSLLSTSHLKPDLVFNAFCAEPCMHDDIATASGSCYDVVSDLEKVPNSLSVLATAACNIYLDILQSYSELNPDLKAIENYDKTYVPPDSSSNNKILPFEETQYSIDDRVLVRYFQRKKWAYYAGTIKEMKLQDDETNFSIIFFKTIKKPDLKFVTTKRVDWDEVTQISIVKKLELRMNLKNPKEYFLCKDEDKIFFI